MYQIYKQVNGQGAKAYKHGIYATKSEAQAELRRSCKYEYGVIGEENCNRGYNWLDAEEIESWKAEGVEFDYYDEPGIYNDCQLIISDAEMNDPDFDKYGYDNWFEYIQEVQNES